VLKKVAQIVCLLRYRHITVSKITASSDCSLEC